ncbi:heavy metal-associated isoprenylated plant protein 2-like [Rutidosis leptorrhynchoides]|uniref:heavy metal-associated isoprenylated plant protein 2-like n=1 Tax=Rutidosis leptorrhynchoides TaxID=125765 RepID=UPI003A990CC8
MVLKTVLKVQLSCDKCKKKILKLVSNIQGVDKIEIDAVKDTLTVTGDANPYEIIVNARKAVKCVEVLTIGPPQAPQKKPDEKKPDEKKPDEKKPANKVDEKCPFVPCNLHMPNNSVAYQPVAVVHMDQDPCTTCSIM